MVTSLILEPDDLSEMVDAKLDASTGKEITVVIRALDVEMAKLCALLIRVRGGEAKVVGTLEEALDELNIERVPES